MIFTLVYTEPYPHDPYAQRLAFQAFTARNLIVHLHRSQADEAKIEGLALWIEGAVAGDTYEIFLRSGRCLVICNGVR